MKINLLFHGIFVSIFLLLFATKTTAQTYCTAMGNCSGFDQILNVQLSNLNVNSGACANYSDFTALRPADLFVGTGSLLTVTRATPGGTNVFGAVWIDWNNDGVFENTPSSEQVATFAGPNNYTQTITPPAGTAAGITRMRVRLQGTTPITTACGPGGYEVEDYSIKVNITAPPPPVPTYCTAAGLTDPNCNTQFNNWVSTFSFNGINNTSNCGLVNGYSNYLHINFDVVRGTTYPIVINELPASGAAFFTANVWIDWNQDKDFVDPMEQQTVSNGATIGTFMAMVMVPADAAFGKTRMRVRARRLDSGAETSSPCGTTLFGEVEDYSISIIPPAPLPYCVASGDEGCVEAAANYITNLSLGSINNTSFCDKENNNDGYSNFTNLSTVLIVGQMYNLNFSSGPTSDPADAGAAWIDWNGDGIFNVAPDSEALTVVSDGLGGFSATAISPPASAKIGFTRLRARLRYNLSIGETSEPCGDTQYGEVEDYSVQISNGVLALKLNKFEATVVNKNFAKLHWSNNDEADIEGYELQRSNNGVTWLNATTIKAKNNTALQQYDFVDSKTLVATTFYRLKINGKNGDFVYSDVKTLEGSNIKTDITISPNPAKTYSSINLSVTKSCTATVQIMDIKGTVIFGKNINILAGTNNINIPIKQQWMAGNYIVKIITTDNIFVKQLIIVQ